MSYIELKKDDDGIVELILNQPGKSVNVMGDEYEAAMNQAVSELSTMKDSIAGIYVRSGKPQSFFAGGDIKQMLKMPIDVPRDERKRLFDGIMATKSKLRTLETLGVPVAVGINGAALGGGYEICLACHYRIAVNSPKVSIGLPESAIGLMPGCDGVVRLVRLLGMQPALELISTGRRLNAEKALKKGLINELAADEESMHRRAKAWLKDNPDACQPWDKKGYSIPGGAPGDPSVQGMMFLGPANVMIQTGGNMPSQRAVFAAVADTARVDFDAAQKIEARYFLHLLLDQTSRNMMTAFFIQIGQITSGASRPADIAATRFSRIGILGAGQMGAGIAFAAARAGISVVLADTDKALADKGREYSRKACTANKRIDEKTAEQIMGRITATARIKDFADCDAVIEAVYEDRQVKAQVIAAIAKVTDKSCLLATNTSGLPITSLAAADPHPQRFIGMHFFSPAEKMPLVELIRGKKSDDRSLAMAFDLARQLGKTPIVVNDSPGFFTTRVIAKRISQGMRLITEGVDPVMVENLARQAGYPVGPLALVDEISQQTSLGVAEQAQRDAAENGEEFVENPENRLVRRMVNEFDRRGKRFGKGFYDYPAEGKKRIWPQLRDLYGENSMPRRDMIDRMMYAESLEAVRAMQEGVIVSTADANVGSIMGIGFPAWTGGVLQFINACGLATFIRRSEELADRYGDEFTPPQLLLDMAADGRQFN